MGEQGGPWPFSTAEIRDGRSVGIMFFVVLLHLFVDFLHLLLQEQAGPDVSWRSFQPAIQLHRNPGFVDSRDPGAKLREHKATSWLACWRCCLVFLA